MVSASARASLPGIEVQRCCKIEEMVNGGYYLFRIDKEGHLLIYFSSSDSKESDMTILRMQTEANDMSKRI